MANGHGGRRKGAGRPVGSYTPGVIAPKTKARKELQETRKRIIAEGKSPIDFMLGVMLDEDNDMRLRMDAAKAVAPYVAPRLQAIDVRVDDGRAIDVREISTTQLMEIAGMKVLEGKSERVKTNGSTAN